MSSRNYRILIIDDDSQFHQQIRYAFRKNYEFEGALSIAQLEKKLQAGVHYDLILLDLILDNDSGEKVGFDLIPLLQERTSSVPIIVVTSDTSVYTGVEAIKRGAHDFLFKGEFDYEYWNNTFKKVLINTALKQENQQLKQQLTQVKAQYEYINPPDNPLVGNSAQMEHIRRTLKIIADDPDLTVLITGETGVGKGVAAHFLHYNSINRCNQPFEEIHISNIPKSLLESTLFGAKKGSFTDAKEDIKGRLHIADKGIVFLDEIGELDLDNQVKLLQFLQTKTIRPIGTVKDIKLDVQIVAATNKNLREAVAKREFREDLYQRLKVFPIEIPPLRERREDMKDLLLHFFKIKEEEELKDLLEPDVRHILLEEYNWIGNIRELENAVRGMKVKQKVLEVNKITFECLPDDIRNYKGQTVYAISDTSSSPPAKEHLQVNNITALSVKEQQALALLQNIEQALKAKNGVKKDVAQMLNFNSSDDILYHVKTIRKKFPHLVRQFPYVCENYKIKI